MSAVKRIFFSLLLPLSLALHLAVPAQAGTHRDIAPYSASYEANFNGMAVAATRALSFTQGRYQLSTTAKSFLGGIEESETFRIIDDQILVDHYQHERSLLGSKREEILAVDHDSGVAHYTRKSKVREITLQAGYLGPMSYQIQIRRDLMAGAETFDYQVMHRGKVREYRFELTGEETLSTPAGDIECVTLKRIRDDKERETFFWMAKNKDYLLVKLRQKEDNEVYELTLSGIDDLASKP